MGTSLDLVALHIFKTVAEQGGITRAATKLHRVQSNVTTRVKQLEARLGTPLFVRQRRRLVLSPQGKVLLAYADRLLGLSSEAEAAVQDGAPRGTLQLGTLESTAATRLPPVLARYHRAHPAVRIDLATGTSGALVARVRSQELDAAFVAEPYPGHELAAQPVFVEELVLITPRTFGRVAAARDIGRATVIAFTTGCSYRRRLETWIGRAGIVPAQVLEFASYHAIVACVAAGAGVAVVPRSVIRAVDGRHEVTAHALPRDVARARTMLVWRPGHESSALRALRAMLPRSGRGGRTPSS
jgi:DNA-binding transcriptional LysR family regulator